MGIGWGHIPTNNCTLLLLRLLQCPHTTDVIPTRLIVLVCRSLPGEGGLGLWVTGPEDKPVPALGGWGLQPHGFQGTWGRPTTCVGTHQGGTHRVGVPTCLARLHSRRGVPGLLLARRLPHPWGNLHPWAFLQP